SPRPAACFWSAMAVADYRCVVSARDSPASFHGPSRTTGGWKAQVLVQDASAKWNKPCRLRAGGLYRETFLVNTHAAHAHGPIPRPAGPSGKVEASYRSQPAAAGGRGG